MFDEVAGALTQDAIVLALDLLETPPAVQPYDRLKRRLLRMHQQTPLQRMAKLFATPPMGDRTPSQLLATMIELAPPGQEDSLFLKYMFLERLPDEIRMLLGNEIGEDIRDLAEIADGHAISYGRRHHPIASVSTVDEPEDVNAVHGGKQQRGRGGGSSSKGRGAGNSTRGGGSGRGGSQSNGGSKSSGWQATEPAPGSNLCWYHWNYGGRANRCTPPCSFVGN